MKRVFILMTAAGVLSGAEVSVVDPRVEGLVAPLGIDTPKPRFSWKLQGNARGVRQTAYRIAVEAADSGTKVWDSGEITSGEQLWIAYGGAPLESNTPYRWRVGWKAAAGEASDQGWSEWAAFHTALLAPADWQAQWIRVPYERISARPGFQSHPRLLEVKNTPAPVAVPSGPGLGEWIAAGIQKQMNGVPDAQAPDFQRDRLEELLPAPMFRKTLGVKPGIKRAVLHYCGLGLVEMSLNGGRIGNHTWDPAFTDYDKRAFYLTADVTAMLKPGTNALGAMVGDGWYGQSIGFSNLTKSWRYGDPGLAAQLELVYNDGTRERVTTDASWQCALEGPVVKNGVWCGEFHDATREMPGWDTAGFHADERWMPAVEAAPLSPVLEAQKVAPIRDVETTPVRELANPKPGIWVADLGRILTGVCELKVRDQQPGALILLVFGQSLNPDGTVSTGSGTSCGSWPVDGYVCRGGALETWRPRFTFHAFRYVEIRGLRGEPGKDVLAGHFTSTDLPRAGAFECSVPLFNDLHHALVRTTRGNLRHMYTDTPSRERTGWLTWPNVLSIFDNFDGHAYWHKVAGDLRAGAQRDRVDSHVGHWAKNAAVKFDSGKQEEWMENVGPGMAPGPRGSNIPEQRISNVMYPWEAYVRYGDADLLRDNYTVMKATVDYLAVGRIDGLVPSLVGDWHDAVKPDLNIAYRRECGLERDDTWGAIMGGYPVHTPARACGTVHLWLAADALAKIAGVLGHPDDATKYAALAEELKAAFNRAYFDPATGKYSYTTSKGNTCESQTIYGYALYHRFVPGEKRALTLQRFLEHIAACGGRPTSGQLGMDRVVKALTAAGAEQAAFDLLTVKGFPGFDHMLSFGTETTWETWGEAILNNTPEGSEHILRATRPQEHCQWTGVDSWFYECVLGLRADPQHPGYGHFFLEPRMFRQMAWAKGSYETPRGTMVSDWKCDGKIFQWAVVVPPNTTATAHIPAKSAEAVTESGQPLGKAPGVKFLKMDDGRAVCGLQSGAYRFEARQ